MPINRGLGSPSTGYRKVAEYILHGKNGTVIAIMPERQAIYTVEFAYTIQASAEVTSFACTSMTRSCMTHVLEALGHKPSKYDSGLDSN